MKRPKQRNKKSTDTGKKTFTVTWPKEYAAFATHPTETSLARALALDVTKAKLCRAMEFTMAIVQPTDLDDEFGDGAQNAYKVIKSLTSGARFYSETTGYAYRTAHRYLVVLVARAFGLLQSMKARLNVANAPNFGAYQLMRHTITDNYDAVVGNIPEYEKLLLEMISELNSLPLPSIGGLEKFFEYFAHLYKEDKGLASDYYSFLPTDIGDITYDDNTHTILTSTKTSLQGMNIPALVAEFNRRVAVLRASTDMNNLMADMLNTLPSSRFDWMGVIKAHADFVRDVSPEFITKIGSATLAMGTIPSAGTLNTAGTKIVFDKAALGAIVGNWHFAGDNPVGQFVSTYRGAGEDKCYELMLHNINAKAGFTPAATDPISTTGLILNSGTWVLDIGSPSSAPTVYSIGAAYADSNSTVQTTAEDGGKMLAQMVLNFSAFPKLDMWNYGTNGSDNLFWRREDVKQAAVVDINNNIKAINMMAYSTVHLTTERAR